MGMNSKPISAKYVYTKHKHLSYGVSQVLNQALKFIDKKVVADASIVRVPAST